VSNYSNNLSIFNFSNNEVRIVKSETGEPLFCGMDSCHILGISSHRDGLSRLDDDEKASVVVDGKKGKREMTFITESGLYALIFSSRKAVAKKFRKWVTSDVLPALRKRGFYGRLPANEIRLLRQQRMTILRMISSEKVDVIKRELMADLKEVSVMLGMSVPDEALLLSEAA